LARLGPTAPGRRGHPHSSPALSARDVPVLGAKV